MLDASNRMRRLDFLAAQYDGPIPPAALEAARTGRADALVTQEMRANMALLAMLSRDAVASGKAHRARGDYIAAGRAFERALGYARALRAYRAPWKSHCLMRKAARTAADRAAPR